MAIENSEKTDLRPLNVQVGFVLGLQNVEDNGHSIFVVISDNSLVCVGCIRLNDATLFLTCLCRLVVLQLNSLWI
jgi:hypothetical protein